MVQTQPPRAGRKSWENGGITKGSRMLIIQKILQRLKKVWTVEAFNTFKKNIILDKKWTRSKTGLKIGLISNDLVESLIKRRLSGGKDPVLKEGDKNEAFFHRTTQKSCQ